jgi:hypothetical protein
LYTHTHTGVLEAIMQGDDAALWSLLDAMRSAAAAIHMPVTAAYIHTHIHTHIHAHIQRYSCRSPQLTYIYFYTYIHTHTYIHTAIHMPVAAAYSATTRLADADVC